MVNATVKSDFDSIFDYSSVFQYQSLNPTPKSINRGHYKSVFSYRSININTDEDSDDDKEENWISSVVRKIITALLYAVVIILLPFSVWICIKKVHALERIVLMRLGKLQPIQGPGFTIVLPFIDVWTRVNLRPQVFTVLTSQLLTADGGIVEVQSEVQYQISDVISYVTKLRKQEKALKDLGSCCLANIISEKDQEDLEMKRDEICSVLKHELNQATLKWGLEILNVYLFSIRVLKAAEPVNALGTIMTALKAATGKTSDHATAVFPLVSDESQSNKESSCSKSDEKNGNVLDMFKKVLSAAGDNALTKDVCGNFKFDVVGDGTKTVYCSFENGRASFMEGPVSNMEPDVSLMITEDNVKDFLEKKISPLEAYMDGKVMVSGDWSLLRPLAKMFEEPLLA